MGMLLTLTVKLSDSWHKGKSFKYKTNKRRQELILEEFHLLTYRNQKLHR